jgi:parvulin-like peptidyl-prolyl isomerase
MKKILKLAFAATILYNCYSFAADDKVLGTFKGGEVKASQVAEQFKNEIAMDPALKDKKFEDLDTKVQELLVRAYIDTKLLDQEVKKNKIDESKEFTDKVEMFKKQLSQNELLNKMLTEKVTDALVEEEYKRLVEELKDKEEVKVRHILVKTEKDAKEIKQKLSGGEKFNDLAKKLSEDTSSKTSGGEIGYFTKGQTDPAFEEAAFALKKGGVSNPVKTQFGWHIIKLEDKRKLKLPSKEKGMEIAKSRLSQAAVQKYLEDLRSDAAVKILIETKTQDESSPDNSKK